MDPEKVKGTLETIQFKWMVFSFFKSFCYTRFIPYFDGDFLMEIVELLGYKVHYDKQEHFFYIDLESVEKFQFGFHFALKSGRLELIWVVYEEDEVLLGSPWTRYPRLMIGRDYIIKQPIISDYVDFRDVMKIAFEMYEDFKQAFLKIAAED